MHKTPHCVCPLGGLLKTYVELEDSWVVRLTSHCFHMGFSNVAHMKPAWHGNPCPVDPVRRCNYQEQLVLSPLAQDHSVIDGGLAHKSSNARPSM